MLLFEQFNKITEGCKEHLCGWLIFYFFISYKDAVHRVYAFIGACLVDAERSYVSERLIFIFFFHYLTVLSFGHDKSAIKKVFFPIIVRTI